MTVNLSVIRSPSRLKALKRLNLLDTAPDPQFDRLTRLATQVLKTPVALISLVDETRQFFKSCVGLPEPWATLRQTPLSHSFCQYVVALGQPLNIRDARKHHLFRNSPAIADLGVVAYAGVPLIADDGEIIGSFCVIDHRPRTWTPRQLELLNDIALSVTSEIRLHAVDVDGQAQRASDKLRLYREIIANTSEAIAIIDGNGCYLEQNDRHQALIGYSDEELRGKTLAVHLGEQTFATIIESLSITGSFHGEVVSRARSGEQRTLELSAFAVCNDEGQPICYVGIKRDITERKLAEEALRRRYDQLQTIYHMADTVTRAGAADEIFEAAIIGLRRALKVDRAAVLLFDPDGVMRFKAWQGLSDAYRQAVEGHLPWTVEDSSPQPVLVPDVEADPAVSGYLPVIQAEGIRAIAFIPLVYNGNLLGKFMLYYNAPHQFDREEIHVAQTIASHIAFATERRRNEEEQRFLNAASTQLVSLLDYEQTLASIADIVVPHLADWCIIDVLDDRGQLRQMAAAHADRSKVALIHELRRRYPPDPGSLPPIWKVLQSSRAELAPNIPDSALVRRARDADHLRLLRSLGITSHMVVPLVARGRTLGVISFVAGDSGRRYTSSDLALAEELARRAAFAVDNARLYDDAQRALKVRDQFLLIASHELKTPITALLGYAQLLERRLQRDGEAGRRNQPMLRSLIEQARRLHRLSVSLLELSRIQSGTFSIDRRILDIVSLTHKVIDELQPMTEHHTIELIAPDEALLVEGDDLRLEQVLLNLLYNAIKYSPGGGPITVRIERQGADVHISVADQGIGIPEEARPQLFSRFFRAGNVDPQQISGMGLGLYVAREIVTLHGGTIVVSSKEGEGSTFTVSLPIVRSNGTYSAQSGSLHQSILSRS